MLLPEQTPAGTYEFTAQYQDDSEQLRAETALMQATIAMLERNYDVRGQARHHYFLGVIAMGEQWRTLKHTLAINTVNRPFSLNYKSEACIQHGRKLALPYTQLDETLLVVGMTPVEDRIWIDDTLQKENNSGTLSLAIMLDNLGAMVTEAKEDGWQIL